MDENLDNHKIAQEIFGAIKKDRSTSNLKNSAEKLEKRKKLRTNLMANIKRRKAIANNITIQSE